MFPRYSLGQSTFAPVPKKELFKRSNRNMSSMLAAFSLLSGIDVGYKTVERLYSDPEVEMAIHNLHVLILKKKGVKDVDASGDGTGYSLTIKKHYASETEKKRDRTKEADASTKKAFIYSFKNPRPRHKDVHSLWDEHAERERGLRQSTGNA